jgi:hypothetical protein
VETLTEELKGVAAAGAISKLFVLPSDSELAVQLAIPLSVLRGTFVAPAAATHFQATLSNISFTVYALLPTLSAQVISHLNVETLTEEHAF